MTGLLVFVGVIMLATVVLLVWFAIELERDAQYLEAMARRREPR